MRPKSLILLALALGCGLVASIGISQVMEARNQRAKSGEQTSICVALTDIERNAALSTENVMLKPWPTSELPEGAITKMEDVVGRRPSSRIVKGVPILLGNMGEGEGSGRAAKEIPKGFRSVPVRVNNAENNGLILPGDRVDVQVFAAKNPALDIPQTGTWTILQDVTVFAVNSEIRHEKNGEDGKIEARTISLLVTPDQAAKLTLASEVGRIRLIQRGLTPEAVSDPAVAHVGELLDHTAEDGGQRKGSNPGLQELLDRMPKPEKPPADPGFRMTVISGSETRVAEFHKGETMPRWLSGEGPGRPADDSSGSKPPSDSRPGPSRSES